jgi:hypothetical protein
MTKVSGGCCVVLFYVMLYLFMSMFSSYLDFDLHFAWLFYFPSWLGFFASFAP